MATIIRRTKGGRIHYVAKVSPRGDVELLVEDPNAALAVTPEELEKFQSHYQKRPQAGEFRAVKSEAEVKVVDQVRAAAEKAEAERKAAEKAEAAKKAADEAKAVADKK